MLNPIIIQVIKWLIEKAVIEAGKKLDWEAIKATVDKELDTILPNPLYDRVAKYLVNKLIDVVANYFENIPGPIPPDAVHKAVEAAKDSLAYHVALELLKV